MIFFFLFAFFALCQHLKLFSNLCASFTKLNLISCNWFTQTSFVVKSSEYWWSRGIYPTSCSPPAFSVFNVSNIIYVFVLKFVVFIIKRRISLLITSSKVLLYLLPSFALFSPFPPFLPCSLPPSLLRLVISSITGYAKMFWGVKSV